MRVERIIQASIFDIFAGHEIGRELKAMSRWLDGHPMLVALVADDLRRHGVRDTGNEDYRQSRRCAAGCSSSIVS